MRTLLAASNTEAMEDIAYLYCDTCECGINTKDCNAMYCQLRRWLNGYTDVTIDESIANECTACIKLNDGCIGNECLLYTYQF